MNNPSLVLALQNDHAENPQLNQSSSQAMQAPSSLQAAFPSNRITSVSTTNQVGQPAPGACNIQPQTNYSYDAPNNRRPIYGLEAHGLSTTGTGFHSTLRDPPIDLSINASSIGSSPQTCLAAQGLECWCPLCDTHAEDISAAWNFDANASIDDSTQSYNTYQSVDTRWYNSANTGSSNEYNQDRSRWTYSDTANNESHLAQFLHGSAPNSRRYSGFSFDPTLGSSQASIPSIVYPDGSYIDGLSTDDMRAPRPNTTQRLATPYNGRRQRRKERGPRQRQSPRPRAAISNSSIGSLECAKFLTAQEILCIMLKDEKFLSDSQKQSLARSLEISVEQFEYCLEAKRVLEPVLNNMCLKAQEYGLQNDTVVRWFEQVQSHFREKPSLPDSAYQVTQPARPRDF